MAKAAKTIVEAEVGIIRIRRRNVTITRVYIRNPNVSTYRRICGLKDSNLIGTRNTLLLKTLIKRRYSILTPSSKTSENNARSRSSTKSNKATI